MIKSWSKLVSYREGERCQHSGRLYEARFDLCRGIKPDSLHSEKLWRRLPTVSMPVKATAPASRKAPSGYLTRALGYDRRG